MNPWHYMGQKFGVREKQRRRRLDIFDIGCLRSVWIDIVEQNKK